MSGRKKVTTTTTTIVGTSTNGINPKVMIGSMVTPAIPSATSSLPSLTSYKMSSAVQTSVTNPMSVTQPVPSQTGIPPGPNNNGTTTTATSAYPMAAPSSQQYSSPPAPIPVPNMGPIVPGQNNGTVPHPTSASPPSATQTKKTAYSKKRKAISSIAASIPPVTSGFPYGAVTGYNPSQSIPPQPQLPLPPASSPNIVGGISPPAASATQEPGPKPQLTEKKLRRLEKNRLSARECRRRKREAAEMMLHEINLLEAENVQLRLQLQIGQEAETTVNAEQLKLTSEIDNLLKSGEASEAEIYCTLEEFKEKYADYGHSRRSSIEFHLRNVARLLMPTQTTSVVMHAISSSNNLSGMVDNGMDQARKNDTSDIDGLKPPPIPPNVPSSDTPLLSDYANTLPAATDTGAASATAQAVSSSSDKDSPVPQQPFDPKQLFLFLAKYLDVTPAQAAALKDSRFVAQEMDSCLEEAFRVLSELRDRLTKTGNDLETEFNNVRSILTPTQAAKFLVWVANNAACMHMLNELWDRVYPCG